MKKLSRPKTNKSEILYTLIQKGTVSIMDFPYLSSFRTRISDLKLKDDLPLLRELKTVVNKFGNTYTYVIHRLNPFNLRTAIKLYNKINQ